MSVAKARYVLRYQGEGAKPDADVARVQELADVVDSSSPRMLLVESDHEALRDLVDSLPDWVMGADRAYEVPDTRKKPLRPPD